MNLQEIVTYLIIVTALYYSLSSLINIFKDDNTDICSSCPYATKGICTKGLNSKIKSDNIISYTDLFNIDKT